MYPIYHQGPYHQSDPNHSTGALRRVWGLHGGEDLVGLLGDSNESRPLGEFLQLSSPSVGAC